MYDLGAGSKPALMIKAMKEITSGQNRTYRLFRKLSQKKHRDALGLYLIEGRNLLEEALKSGAEAEAVMIRKGAEGDFPAKWLGGKDVYSLDEKLFDAISETETSQGIIAAVRKSAELPLEEAMPGAGGNAVVLDRLQDPGNIGTVIRTAEAAGYGAVIALKGTADVYSPKAVRAAAGALFRIKILTARDAGELIEAARRSGKRLVVSRMDGEADYTEADIRRDVVLVIGNEGSGVSAELSRASDVRVRIPMAGKTESLNAAVAAALLMYEARRKDKDD